MLLSIVNKLTDSLPVKIFSLPFLHFNIILWFVIAMDNLPCILLIFPNTKYNHKGLPIAVSEIYRDYNNNGWPTTLNILVRFHILYVGTVHKYIILILIPMLQASITYYIISPNGFWKSALYSTCGSIFVQFICPDSYQRSQPQLVTVNHGNYRLCGVNRATWVR